MTRIQVLNPFQLRTATMQIIRLGEKLHNNGTLGLREGQLLRACQAAGHAYALLDSIDGISVYKLRDLPKVLAWAMDAVSTHLQHPNVVPEFYAKTLKEFEALMESYGLRIVELKVQFDPDRIDRAGDVKALLASAPEAQALPGPTVYVYGREAEPRGFYPWSSPSR